MKKLNTLTTIVSALALSACAQTAQEAYSSTNERPKVYNACEKIDALLDEHSNNFDRVKGDKIKTRLSNIWKAKHHLVGQDCQVWSWGANRSTYSCSTSAPSKEVALEYFNSAKNTAAQCLGNAWTLSETKRINDDGLKAEFSHPTNKAIVATHIVPTKGLFKSEWTVYYYVGSEKR